MNVLDDDDDDDDDAANGFGSCLQAAHRRMQASLRRYAGCISLHTRRA